MTSNEIIAAARNCLESYEKDGWVNDSDLRHNNFVVELCREFLRLYYREAGLRDENERLVQRLQEACDQSETILKSSNTEISHLQVERDRIAAELADANMRADRLAKEVEWLSRDNANNDKDRLKSELANVRQAIRDFLCEHPPCRVHDKWCSAHDAMAKYANHTQCAFGRDLADLLAAIESKE